MKKYKLIKEYPNSPKLGTIIFRKVTGEDYWTYDNSTIILFRKDNPEIYLEFWEPVIEYLVDTKVFNSQTNATYIKKEDGWYREPDKTSYTDDMITKSNHINVIEDKVVEKDYEILSYTDGIGNIFTNINNPGGILERCDFIIHSIKRLSDNEVFTIGDKLTDNFIIKEFEIKNNNLLIWFQKEHFSAYIKPTQSKWGNVQFDYINSLEKIKQSILTTEDNVELFEKDRYFICMKTLDLTSANNEGIITKFFKQNSNYLYFSTKEALDKHIIMNKPSLSLNDIQNNSNITVGGMKSLIYLVKQKLNK